MADNSEARGKIYLINRIDDSLDFGTPIDIPNNTKGSHLAPTRNRAFDVYVQDYYQLSLKPITACAAKYKVVKEAIDLRNSNYNHEKDSQMHLCFCSAFRDGFGVYIMEDIINYIADLKKKKNLRVIPWMMFDYPFISYTAIFRYYNVNVVNAVIEVNYSSYGGGLLQDDFTVKTATGEEL